MFIMLLWRYLSQLFLYVAIRHYNLFEEPIFSALLRVEAFAEPLGFKNRIHALLVPTEGPVSRGLQHGA